MSGVPTKSLTAPTDNPGLPDNMASFGSRWPNQFFRHDGMAIDFHHAEYHTTDPQQIAFLLGVAKDSRNRDVWVRSLPRPPEHATTGRQPRARQKRVV